MDPSYTQNSSNEWDFNSDEDIYGPLTHPNHKNFNDPNANPESVYGSYLPDLNILYDGFQTATYVELSTFTSHTDEGASGSQKPVAHKINGPGGEFQSTDKGSFKNTYAQTQEQGENTLLGSTPGREQQLGQSNISFLGGSQTQTLADQENSLLSGPGDRNLVVHPVGPASVYTPESGLKGSVMGSGASLQIKPKVGPICPNIHEQRNAKKRNANAGTCTRRKKARAGNLDTNGEAEVLPAPSAEDEEKAKKVAEQRKKEAERSRMNRAKEKIKILSDKEHIAQLTKERDSLQERLEKSKLTCIICTRDENVYCEVHAPSILPS